MLSESQMIAMLRTMTGEANGDVLSTYLHIAGQKILRKAYPFDDSKTEVPGKYQCTQLEVATFLLNKRGAEGETAHNENGISRTYSGGDVPPALLREVTPFASTIGGAE